MWLKIWRRKQRSLRRSLKNTHIHGIFGKKIFDKVLWKSDKNSIAGGLALGLFIAFTPTIPFQMLLAGCGAFYLRVNLPITLIAVWVTNPLTVVPIYMLAWKIGKYIVINVAIVQEALELYSLKSKSGRIIQQAIYLWTGSLVFSFVSAVSANISVKLLWNLIVKVAHKNKLPRNNFTSSDRAKQNHTIS